MVKILKPGYEARVSQEVTVLQHLEQQEVTHILSGELVTNSTIYFPKVLFPVEVVSGRMVVDLVSLLKVAHTAGVIHRDVRPDNIMVDEKGFVYLIDWGCACLLDGSSQAPVFEGTFRFASDTALSAAISGINRAPEAKDDLESLVRSVLAINSPDVLRSLSEIKEGEFRMAKDFWDTKKQHRHFDDLCGAAQRLDYEYLKNQIVI